MEEDSSKKVLVKFVTKLPEPLVVPPAPINVPVYQMNFAFLTQRNTYPVMDSPKLSTIY